MKGRILGLCACHIMMFLFLTACGGNNVDERKLIIEHNNPIGVSLEGKKTDDCFVEEFCADLTKLVSENTTVSMMRRNGSCVVYVENYWESGAQNPWKYQVWRMNTHTKEKTLLYETADVFLLNELYVNEQYAYWVEHVFDESEMTYYLKQCELKTGSTMVIAERNGEEVGPISLWVSEEYVTWMDTYASGETQLSVLDVETQKYLNLPEIEVVRFMPYARLTVVENGITYFSTDDKECLYVNRYSLKDSSIKSVKIGALNRLVNTEKVADCFSNDRYVGWLTEYGRGTYYIYDTESEKQYCIEGINAFIELMWDNEMLFYISGENRMAIFNLEKGTFTYQEDLPGSGTQLLYYQDSIPYITVNNDSEIRILSFR